MNLKVLISTALVAALSLNPLFAQNLNIKDFGAVGDGKTLCTQAIQAAVDKASETGATVTVPAGTYLSGTIFIKSNVHLYLAGGSMILGSDNIKDYTAVRWGHHEDRTPWHLIVVKDARNVQITGSGTIDGNGFKFWEPKRKHEWAFYREIENRPSPMIEIDGSKKVLVSGITIQNSAGWGLHALNSDDVKLTELSIFNNAFGPNSDGIDITGCQNVVIANNNIEVGDDAIALKTTEDSAPCEYITITNCVLSTNCVALRIGYESRKDFRYITATNLIVKNSSRIVDIRTFEGAEIEHVIISNVVGETNSGWPLNRVIEMEADTVNTPYAVEIPEHPNYHKIKPVRKQGSIRDVLFSNWSIKTDGRIMMAAQKGHVMKDIRLENMRLEYAMLDEPSPLADRAKSHGFFLNMKDVRTAKAAIVARNIENLSVNDITIQWPEYPVPHTWNLLNTEWRFLNSDFYKGKENDIRSGKVRSTFRVFQGIGLKNPNVNVNNQKSSDPKLPAVLMTPLK